MVADTSGHAVPVADSAADTLSVSQAARLLDVPERTLRRWMSAGKIPSQPDPTGAGRRVVRVGDLQQLRRGAVNYAAHNSGGGHVADTMADSGGHTACDGGQNGGHWPANMADTLDNGLLNSASHDVSPDAAGERFSAEPVRGEGGDGRFSAYHAELIEQQRDQALSEVQFLRQQLQAREDARREEMERVDREKEELRKLLAMSQHALQTALERPVLPPHVETPAPVKKARWWFFGRRQA